MRAPRGAVWPGGKGVPGERVERGQEENPAPLAKGGVVGVLVRAPTEKRMLVSGGDKLMK